ncbi:MAG: AAA family ATPase, partial [Verrucomicrobiota bacterium]
AQMAESMAPCVLWIDEIEKAFASGRDSSADGGTSQRLLASFLTWMQEKEESVFLVATANNLEALPPEMIRKGRFDEIFFVDLPNPSERLSIWDIHLRLRKQAPEQFNLGQLAQITDGFSGAEIEQAVIAALYRALEKGLPLNQELLVREIYETVPLSISRAEELSRLRRYAKKRFVSASNDGSDPNSFPAAA